MGGAFRQYMARHGAGRVGESRNAGSSVIAGKLAATAFFGQYALRSDGARAGDGGSAFGANERYRTERGCVLSSGRFQAGATGSQHHARVPWNSTAVCPVSRSSICQLETAAVLANGGVL